MQQFIPFEDEWDLLDRIAVESLSPYRPGLHCRHDLARGPDQRTVPMSPSTSISSPICTPMRAAVPARSSST